MRFCWSSWRLADSISLSRGGKDSRREPKGGEKNSPPKKREEGIVRAREFNFF